MPNSIGQWPLFQSCSTSKGQAMKFSIRGQKGSKQWDPKSPDAEILIFKIYLSDLNTPHSNIDLSGNATNPKEWTFYPREKEVNLLPFFTFQVCDITQSPRQRIFIDKNTIDEAKITEVTLVEIPYQNLNLNREVMQASVIWFDRNIETE